MYKSGLINLTQPLTHIDKINETAISINQSTNNYQVDEEPFHLINKEEFIALAKKNSAISNPEHFWDIVLGQYQHNNKEYKNHQVQYLTDASANLILVHSNKFQQGIDFQHLAKGFYLTTNPHTQRCEVLHYSSALKEAQKLEQMPLAITLVNSEQPIFEEDNAALFSGKKEECYQLLLSKIKNYCSKEEFNAAFKYFSNLMEHEKDLSYDDFFLSQRLREADINPIVLLGRWETVMSNHQLKQTDRLLQWQALSALPLYSSYEAIRALTDYFGDDNPCGFLLPEMELTIGKLDWEKGYRTINDFNQLGGFVIDFEQAEKFKNNQPNDIKILKNKLYLYVKNNKLYCSVKEAPAVFKEIPIPETLNHYQSIVQKIVSDGDNLKRGQSKNPLSLAEENAIYDFARMQSYKPMSKDEVDFWRYIAYQPKRNSIAFYKKAIALIQAMQFKEAFKPYKGSMYKLLAACTTQKAHKAESIQEEEQELQTWKKLCDRINNLENNLPFWMRKAGIAAGKLIEGKAVADYIHGNTAITIYPHLEFQDELFAADIQTIYSLELRDLANPDAKIKKIDEHRMRFVALLAAYSTDVYEGARFYRQQGTWRPLSIQDYILLQHQLHQRYPKLAGLIVPHLSTFNLTQLNQFNFLDSLQTDTDGRFIHENALRCVMFFWKDAINNNKLTSSDLTNLWKIVQNQAEFEDGTELELNVLHYLKEHFRLYFPEGYFENKEQLLENQAFDLTEVEKKQLNQYQFKVKQVEAIEIIETTLKRKNKVKFTEYFIELNNQFSKLRYVLTESDFNFLMQHLITLKEEFSHDISTLIELIKQIQAKGSISSFIQVIQSLQKTAANEALSEQIIFFIKEIKPIITQLKEQNKLAFNGIAFEEILILLLLSLNTADMKKENFHEDIEHIILTLNDIAKTNSIAKSYLLSTVEFFLKQNKDFTQIKQFVESLKDISTILSSSLKERDTEEQNQTKEGMLTFHSLLIHFYEKPDYLIKLLEQMDKLDPSLILENIEVKEISQLPLQEFSSNSLYLKKINNEIIEYTFYDKKGNLQPPFILKKEACSFFNSLIKELTPAIQLTNEQEKKLWDLIKKQRQQSSFSWLFNWFKKEEVLSFIPLSSEEQLEHKNPSTVYLYWSKDYKHLHYLITDVTCKTTEQGFIESDQLNEEEFKDLNKSFNPEIKLSSDLSNEILAYVNEHIKKTTRPIQKRFIFQLVSRLLNNGQSIQGLDKLISYLNSTPEAVAILIKSLDRPPYPDVESIYQWLKENKFIERYNAYCRAPYGPRELSYAFQESYYAIQKTKYEGLDTTIFTDELGAFFSKQLSANRKKSIPQLQEELNKLRSLSDQEFSLNHKKELLCLCIEFLARTAGQTHPEDPKKIISQELNTTQVMTVYAMLATNNPKLITQIDTGEGKSRMAMILAACEILRGKTVDILTSDILLLAQRDYLAYFSFFMSLGIPSSLITFNTPPELYCKNGVNFSDDRQLLLLRNQSDILGNPFFYLTENKKNRCVILDEEDIFRHDKATDLYNYAITSTRLKSFTWIYPHLVQFIDEQLKQAEKANVKVLSLEALIPLFIQYAQKWETEVNYNNLLILQKERPAQISTWLNSAYHALRLTERQHYTVTPNNPAKMFTVVDSNNKARLTRKVLILDQGRTIEDSTYPDGLHQCLCFLENQKNKDGFVLFPENATVRSSLTTNFIAQYKEGQLYGISGTTRSHSSHFDKDINHEHYHYIITPREKDLQREDKPIWLAKDEKQQIQFIKKAIIKQLKRNEPILLICKDDNQSQSLYQALTQDPEVASLLKKHQYIHALSTPEEKKQAIDDAGGDAVLTIATSGNFARGIDIPTIHSLLVLSTFVPTFEDEIQIKGRTARNGKKGEYRMILNLQDSNCAFNGATENAVREIYKLQGHWATQAAFREEASKLYADFLEEITQLFLKEYHEVKLSDENGFASLALLEEWSNYLGLMQKDWKKCRGALLLALESQKRDVFINQFQSFVDKWFLALPSYQIGRSLNLPPLHYVEQAEKIYKSALLQGNFFKLKKTQIKIQHAYDSADEGQARIYDVPFAQWGAIIKGERAFFANYYAWKEGRGQLFPDLMATLKGERPLFANLIAILSRWIRELKELLFTPKNKEIILDIFVPSSAGLPFA